MKVLTEAALRDMLRCSEPENFVVPEGMIISPAAREYLQQRKIKILDGKEKKRLRYATADAQCTDVKPVEEGSAPTPSKSPDVNKAEHKYIDFISGAYYESKPEHMTQLHGNVLISKGHPRIVFRGKLDRLQADVVQEQAILSSQNAAKGLMADLSDILNVLREIMKADVLNLPLPEMDIIGLNHKELRAQSHDPQKYYNIKQMLLPDYTMGCAYAAANKLRAEVREVEVAAVEAFASGVNIEKADILEVLNRLSSAFHIMMCRILADYYK